MIAELFLVKVLAGAPSFPDDARAEQDGKAPIEEIKQDRSPTHCALAPNESGHPVPFSDPWPSF